jgi:hypothetical protein
MSPVRAAPLSLRQSRSLAAHRNTRSPAPSEPSCARSRALTSPALARPVAWLKRRAMSSAAAVADAAPPPPHTHTHTAITPSEAARPSRTLAPAALSRVGARTSATATPTASRLWRVRGQPACCGGAQQPSGRVRPPYCTRRSEARAGPELAHPARRSTWGGEVACRSEDAR